MLPNLAKNENTTIGPECCLLLDCGLTYHEHHVTVDRRQRVWFCFLDCPAENGKMVYGCLTKIRGIGKLSCAQFAAQYAFQGPDLHERLSEDAGGYDQ
jgi:hypothetical protein